MLEPRIRLSHSSELHLKPQVFKRLWSEARTSAMSIEQFQRVMNDFLYREESKCGYQLAEAHGD